MLEQVLREIKNYFIREVYEGTFTISNGALADIDFLLEDQYFRIDGSLFNDGVYQYPATKLKDETFTGEVWAMAVPPTVIALSEEIEAWCEKNKDVVESPFTSESFGGYSYQKGLGASGSGGISTSGSVTWQDIFAKRLNQWRKIKYESSIRRNEYMRNT